MKQSLFCDQSSRMLLWWLLLTSSSSNALQPTGINVQPIPQQQQQEYSRRSFAMATASMVTLSLFPSANAQAMVINPKTGIALPEKEEIEQSIPVDWTDVENPFQSSSNRQFGRLDGSPDSMFYQAPRFVEHVDEPAVKTMTSYISQQAIPAAAAKVGDDDVRVLDLCSSWTSHIDLDAVGGRKPKRISGLGMNDKELAGNPVLDDWVVKDLNEDPKLPYEDNSFDVVLCQLSIDYLTKPLQVLQEASRVMRPGGTIHILFSNRLFLSKAIALWTGADDIDHAYTVGCYLHFCGGGFQNIQAKDLSIRKGKDRLIASDPLYVVTATKG
ncbi:ubiE/COQ5 methyltransferase family [Seminavis robusta]|uniref:UbiE/COQ5 methyltransferase family n=1 Tax=Seminavis robusta TaxID=568900 RepID=A0A9N8HTW3_9STRA|nr:ubiE/COQ5 methyltransferase family [Seminavis robusta]|eukprot:Sro1323_g262680.1 ubiE/COQ5 methyltransferase family (328) ;mRNA; f:19722-20909